MTEDTFEVLTCSLDGELLNWAVRQCELLANRLPDNGQRDEEDAYNPAGDWAQGGPIIEREKMGFWWATHCVDAEGAEHGNHWYAETRYTDDKPQVVSTGHTPLVAAMRCYVASQLGDTLEVDAMLVMALSWKGGTE